MIRKIPPFDSEALTQGLKRLKLRHIRDMLQEVNEIALEEEASYVDFLSYLVNIEVEGRNETQRQKRLKAAKFPALKTLDEFDFSFQTSLSHQTIRDLAAMDFVENRENVVLLGPPGVGKSHLAVSLGYEAVQKGYRVRFFSLSELVEALYAALADGTVAKCIRSILKHDLIIIDEVGYQTMDDTASDHVFQLIAAAYEQRSLVVTSNLDFAEWGGLFASTSVAAAVLDRLLHHAHVFSLRGESYRVRNRVIPQPIG